MVSKQRTQLPTRKRQKFGALSTIEHYNANYLCIRFDASYKSIGNLVQSFKRLKHSIHSSRTERNTNTWMCYQYTVEAQLSYPIGEPLQVSYRAPMMLLPHQVLALNTLVIRRARLIIRAVVTTCHLSQFLRRFPHTSGTATHDNHTHN